MEKDKIKELIEKGLSTYKIAKELKCGNSTVIYWIKKLGLGELYKSKSKYTEGKNFYGKKYTKEILETLVKNSNNLTEVIEKLGLVPRGRNFDTLKNYIKVFNLDASHFNKNIKRLGLRFTRDIDFYLKEGSKIGSSKLKDKLYHTGLKERICELCGQNEEWRGFKISLILDHKNGNYRDNRLENLRIVCPNCNATLSTHCGKNIK